MRRSINVLNLNAVDGVGGAAISMKRLSEGLASRGLKINTLRGYRQWLERYPEIEESLNPHRGRFVKFLYMTLRKIELKCGLPNWWTGCAKGLMRSDFFKKADVLNLHNIHGGYFDLRRLPQLSNSKAVVWTLHDMWAMTGGCAFSYECRKWKTGCNRCPLFLPGQYQMMEPFLPEKDQTKIVWLSKKQIYKRCVIHLIVPSRWLLGVVKESIVKHWPVSVIPNGLSLKHYYPLDKEQARSELKLDVKGKYILCAAAGFSYRKGYDMLMDSLNYVKSKYTLITMGHGEISQQFKEKAEIVSYGHVSDVEMQRRIYSAADVYAFPSRADNNPLVVMESMACGTPVVGFDVGGVGELIEDEKNGHLVRAFDTEKFGLNIDLLLNDNIRRKRYSESGCLRIMNGYALEQQVDSYVKLYEEILKKHRCNN